MAGDSTAALDAIAARLKAATPGPWRWQAFLHASGSERTYAGYPQRRDSRPADGPNSPPAPRAQVVVVTTDLERLAARVLWHLRAAGAEANRLDHGMDLVDLARNIAMEFQAREDEYPS